MGCHRRYVSVLKALLTTDAEDITCGQKRHTRNSGSTYLSERMPGTDATSLANFWNRCYKFEDTPCRFGKLLEQMLQVRRHSLQTTLPCVESTVEHQKMLRARQFFNILTFKCAFRHSGVQSTVEHQKMLRARQFFNILTFKCAFRHRIHSRTSKNAASTTVF